MAGSNNFKQWNPTAANQHGDGAYTADCTAGCGTGAIFTSLAANKLFFQASTMVTALADAMAAKNYNMLDSSLANLATALGNILTQADIITSAITNGYVKLPGGLIIQWGHSGILPDASPQSESFNAGGFPTACFGGVATQNNDTGANVRPIALIVTSRTDFTLQATGSNATAFWIAIGH